VLQLDRDIYDDPAELALLTALGTAHSVPAEPATEGLVDRWLRRALTSRERLVRVEGTIRAGVIQTLLKGTAPARAIAGDDSPAEAIEISREGRVIYALYDYGRTQLLDVTAEELEELRRELTRLGLDPALLVPAPLPLL